MHLTAPVDKGLPKNLLFSFLMQAALLVISGFVSDFGESSRIILYSIVTFWVTALLVILRRRKKHSQGDLVFSKYGFIFILIAIGLIFSLKANLMES